MAGSSRDRLERDMRAALTRDELEVVYQPQYAASDGFIMGAEALARWRHPVLGSIGPETVFAVAARAGLHGPVSRHIMQLALAQGCGFPKHLRLSINITAQDLAEDEFAHSMAAAIRRSGFASERLVLEITEQALVHDLDDVARELEHLTAAGTSIALDDFGAGFCNFRYLKALPLAAIKLDRSMVTGIADDPRDRAILRGMIVMADALGLYVVAEGIETDAQRDAAAAEGCAYWQGFLGSRPLPADEFLALVAGEVR